MVYSASSARTLLEGEGDGTAYLVKYLVYGGVGLVAMQVLVAPRARRAIRRITPAAADGLVRPARRSSCCPAFGVTVNGARRWLGAGPLQFQPSEMMKLALVLHTAAVISARPKIARNLRLVVVPVLGVAGIAVLLILGQPDLGTALVIAVTLAAMLVAAGLPLRQLGLIAAAGAVLVLIFAILEPYRRARLTAFLNPWADAGGVGLPGRPGPDRDRLRRAVRRRPRPVGAEDLLPARGAHGLHPRGDRRGARAWPGSAACCSSTA